MAKMTRAFMRFPEGRAKALTLSYDDGVEQDIRLIEILDRFGIKATFNINSGCYSPEGTVFEPGRIHRRMSRTAAIDLYKNSPHEVAVHTVSHPYLETLPVAAVAREVIEDRMALESDFGVTVRGMAYPFGTYNDAVVEVLRSAGISYSRTVQSTEKFDMPTDWLRLPATCHHTSSKLMELAQKFVDRPQNLAPKMFYLWGHSYEFERDDNWDVIENFCALVGGREDIWYATNIEIYDYTKAYESLIWSADMSLVTNPSATPIWFKFSLQGEESSLVTLGAGETKKLF
jgi:hypothetical protein